MVAPASAGTTPDLSAHGHPGSSITNPCETVLLHKGDRLFDQGKPVDHFYVLRQGLLGIYRHVSPGKKVLVHKVGPGESTGLSQSMSDSSFPGELVPIKESVAYRGGPQTIDALCENCPADVSRLLAQENGMNHDIFRMIDDILGKDLNARIAHQLLDLASRIGKDTEGGIRLVIKLTRKEISQMVGCAQESAIRVMSEWEKQGWIETDRKFITLIQSDRLRAI